MINSSNQSFWIFRTDKEQYFANSVRKNRAQKDSYNRCMAQYGWKNNNKSGLIESLFGRQAQPHSLLSDTPWPAKGATGAGCGGVWSVVSTHRDTRALSTDQLKQSSRCSDCSGARSTYTRFLVCSPKGYQNVKRSKFQPRARARVVANYVWSGVT